MSFVGFTCFKIALTMLNILYLMVSFVLIALAAYGKAVLTIETFPVMGGIIACGIFLLLIAIIGLIGTIQHHQVLLFFYMVILFLLFFVQFALACTCLALTSSQQKKLVQGSWKISSDDQKMNLQRIFNCCGFDESADNDSYTSQFCEKLHLTCCENLNNKTVSSCDQCSSCWAVISDPIDRLLKTVGGVSLFFSFSEIIGVLMTMRYRNQKDPYANPNAFL